MKDPKVIDTKVVFGPVRLSYCHVFQKYSTDGNDGKYQTGILIPKSEKKTIAAIEQAVETAKKQAVATKKWTDKQIKKLEMPLKDGDDKEDENYEGHLYVNAKCNTRPGVIDKKGQPVVDEEEIYSGVWAYVSVSFYGYDVNGNRGIACGLNNIKKFKDDDHFGGRVSAEADFADFDSEDDDDL